MDHVELGLVKLCEAVGLFPAELFSRKQAALEAFVSRLRDLTGVDAELWMVELLGGELQQSNEAPVRYAGVLESSARSLTVDRLVLCDRLVDMQSEQHVSIEVLNGPRSFSDIKITKGECCAIFRIRLDFALIWVRFRTCDPPAWDWTHWRNLLPATLEAFIRRLHGTQRQSFLPRRAQFYQQLLDVVPSHPGNVFSNLCKAWFDFSGALWAWLWIHCEFPLQGYHLASTWSEEGENDPNHLPPSSAIPSPFSAAALAVRTRDVVVVPHAPTWEKKFDGDTYRVFIPDDMVRLGGPAFITVPVIVASSDDALLGKKVRGAVCLHYANLADMPSVPFRALRIMGIATAQAIVNSTLYGHRNILMKLNQLATKHLTRISKRPEEDRRAYLKEVIKIIQDDLHFRCVSIFYRRPFSNEVECLATTGICKRGDSKAISGERLGDVVYREGQGRTGDCFARCEPLVYSSGDIGPEGFVGEYVEIDPGTGNRGEPFVLYPIPDPVNRTGKKTALGVIRCVSTSEPVASDILAKFTPVDLAPLELIAEQVGPVLQTFESHIVRERTISIIKHDLYSPLNMIRDTIDQIQEDVAAGRAIGEYALKNLSVAGYFASNLVDQLDPTPDQLAVYSPIPTWIEGDILARAVTMLRHLAWEQNRMKIDFNNIRVIPSLNVDRVLIERAIHNLIVNAIKYGEPDTTISVYGKQSRAGFTLNVANFGIGIEPEDEKYLFTAGFRSPKARRTAMGVGLGLSIAKTAIVKHGGNLFLTQAKNPTIFSLFFPRQLAASSERASP